MRRYPEAEKIISRISTDYFPKNKSARELGLDTSTHVDMLELKGNWKIVGWALADDVAPREMCSYVVLCEKDGIRMWCHIGGISLLRMSNQVTNDPSKIVPL